MRVITAMCCVAALAAATGLSRSSQSTSSAAVAHAYAFAEPGISPDGREIAFTSGGDIWTVPVGGGDAHLLVTDSSTDRRPLFSPDGRHLAFISTRTGGGDIYLLSLANGDLRRLTWDDGLEQLDAWSPDSQWIYFSSASHDIAAMNDVFRVPADGGTPQPVSEERYANEFGAAPSPDGKKVAFVARGIASTQWWRKGSSHIDQSELWLRDLEDGAPVQIIPRSARVMWPMWGPDSRTLIYVSDRGGAENVWQRPAAPGGTDRRLTSFTSGRVLWPSATRDARTVAFERDFAIWTLDVGSGQARQVPVVRRGAPTSPSPERIRQTNRFSDLALSPDGRKIAFVAHGDIFAVSARDGGDATRVTLTAAIESQPVWAPDSRRLAYVSASRAGQHIHVHDFTTNASSALTSGAVTDLSPVFSPDGTRLAFLRNRRELRVLDVGSKIDRVVATGVLADTIDSPKPAWSPDGRWLAVFAIGTKAFTNVEIVPAEGGTLVPVSFLANTDANSMAWSADGTYLLFDTRQRTESGQLARVDLVPRTPKFREDLFRDLFSEAGSDVPGSGFRVRASGSGPVFTDIRQRLSFVPTGLDVAGVTISRDGKTAAFVANSAGQPNIYSYALDDLAAERPVARQLTTTVAEKENPQFTPDGRDVMFLEAGRIQIANVERRDSRALNVTAEFSMDFDTERDAVFDQAWTLLRENFFDATFHGIDWDASRERYGRYAASAATPDELRRIINLMMGDLNASHMGVSSQAAAPVIGHLGLRFDRLEYESSGRLRVVDIVPLGPAALASDINVGDVIAAAGGRAIDARTSLDELLANRIDRRVALTIVNPSGVSREVPVRPVSQATEKALLYREWVEHNREYVLKASGGRLGYVHMINMSAAALDQLHLDLDSANHKLDGVIIDLRNNTGGFVNAYALDVFTRQPYLRMSTRGVPEAPGRSVSGQRALEAATTLVVNQHSLSDAEDFTEGYRTLKVGPVVGEPTAGWIIYTWDVRLVDGSTLRLPRMRVKAADGSDMEMSPRKVDVAATRPLGESAAGKDTQLDEAIKALLKKLGRAE
jgi:Tol biopolymer transport system component/C-terminal processing protease CtpA/Prc